MRLTINHSDNDVTCTRSCDQGKITQRIERQSGLRKIRCFEKATHLFFNPNVFAFLKRNRFLFFYKKNKDPILNCFYCIMQYHHFQNYITMTCYTYYDIQIWGWRNVPHLCLIHFKVMRLGKNAHSKQRQPLPHKLQFHIKFIYMPCYFSIYIVYFFKLWIGEVQHQKQLGCREARHID